MANAIQKISARAKQMYKNGKAGRSWKQCIKSASAEYRGGKLGKAKTARKRKPVKRKSKTSYRQTGKSNRKNDMQRTARPPGARKPKGGKKVTYYERRKNRSDVPGSLTGTSAMNEMVLRNLRERNANLITGETRLRSLQRHYKDLPKGVAKNMIKTQIREAKKYIRTIKSEIQLLKRNIK